MGRFLGLGLMLAMVLLTAMPTSAMAACANGRCWGAVGVGPGGAWGSAYDFPSQNAAARAVQNNCEGDCTTIKTFYNSCGAIAQGDNGGWGWAWHPSKQEAQSRAIAYCVPNDRNCRIATWACTSR